MIRIIYVAEALTRNSGVASVIINFIQNITSDDIKIDLLTYKNGDANILENLKKYGVNIFYIPELGLNSFMAFRKAVNDFFEKHEYDIVHSHFNQVDSIIFKSAKRHGVKVCISHSHNTKLSDSKIKAIRNRILCYDLPKEATIWAACSEDAGKCLYGKHFSDSPKKLIIHNGVDCENFKYDEVARSDIRNEFYIAKDEILIGNIGGFRIQKNHVFRIEMFNALHKRNTKYKLLLVGDGDLKTVIERKVKVLGLQDYVIFAGTRTDINRIMSGLDLFILPSLYEGLPVVGVEAQAAGLNCIFSDSITTEANLTGVSYLSLKSSIEVWCSQIENMEIQHDISKNYRVKKEGFDIITECKKLSAFYVKEFNKYYIAHDN